MKKEKKATPAKKDYKKPAPKQVALAGGPGAPTRVPKV